MPLSKFIASRATARVLLDALKASSSSASSSSAATISPPTTTLSSPVDVDAPCDFRKSHLNFQVQNNQITYQGLELPRDILESIVTENSAYEVLVKNVNTKKAGDNLQKKMELLPLTIPSEEGIVFKLAEPEGEPEMEGPILYLHNLKMHLTKDYPSVLSFPRELAEAAHVRKGDNTLDMFFGLGYCTRAALEMGASKVVTFEMYNEVLQLAAKNPFSPDQKDPRIILQQRDIINSIDMFFKELLRKKTKYNSCIIDPAKKKVMEKVYTSRFLLSLSEFIAPGARVAAYVPDAGIAKKFQDLREDIVTTFESTKQYRFKGNHNDNKFIFNFERK